MHIVARKGDLKQLKKILKAGANVNEADNAGRINEMHSFYQAFFFQDGHPYMKVQ